MRILPVSCSLTQKFDHHIQTKLAEPNLSHVQKNVLRAENFIASSALAALDCTYQTLAIVAKVPLIAIHQFVYLTTFTKVNLQQKLGIEVSVSEVGFHASKVCGFIGAFATSSALGLYSPQDNLDWHHALGLDRNDASISQFLKPSLLTVGQAAPFLGMGLGVLTATAARFKDNATLIAGNISWEAFKDKGLCRKGFSNPILNRINGLKQLEIQTFAFAIPAAVLLVGGVFNAAREAWSEAPSVESKVSKMAFTLKKLPSKLTQQMTLEKTAFFVGLVAISLLTALFEKALGFKTPSFDTSGHMMMNMASSAAFSVAISILSSKTPRLAMIGFVGLGALNSIANAFFVYNTTLYCHTLPEIVGGGLWGASVIMTGYASEKVAAVCKFVFQRRQLNDKPKSV